MLRITHRHHHRHHHLPIWLLEYQCVGWDIESESESLPKHHQQHLLLFTPHTYTFSHTMHPSTFLVSSLAIFGAHAAPALPKIDLKNVANPAAALDALSDYFNLIASKVQTSKVQPVAPICDLSKAQMPTSKYSFGTGYRQTWTNKWHQSSHWVATSICRLDAASRCRRPRHPKLHV